MADDIDRYGISAQFSFLTEGKSLTSMGQVVSQLQAIESAAKSASTAVKQSGLGASINQLAQQVNSQPIQKFSKATKLAANNVVPLRKEFRALKAEFRNIEFPSDLYDDSQWKSATHEVHQYVNALKEMEGQLERTTTEEREFAAQLVSAQKAASQRAEMAELERKSAIAGQRLGTAQIVKSIGQGVTGFFDEPLAQSREFSKELSDINKLAGYLTDSEQQLSDARQGALESTRSAQVTKDLINLSNATGTAREEVSALYADLAGAGKDFSNTGAMQAEAEGILKVKTALDITTDAATALDIQLGSTYGKSAEKYGGIVKLNERIASSFNVLADELPNVKIDAEGITNIFTGLASAIGDVENFKPPDIAAFAAALNATGVEKEVASSFIGRFDKSLATKGSAFADALGMSADDFSKMANEDYLGVIQLVADKFSKLKTVEQKGSFFESLGIASAQDQKLIKGLAANTQVLTDARRLSNKGVAEGVSIANEYNKVQGKSAFQTERNAKLVSNLKTLFGQLLEQALLPFLKLSNKILEATTNFVQNNQGLVRIVVVLTYTVGILAAALGGAAVAFFAFQQASATAELALLTINRSVIPLTGFFETAMAAFAGGNPIKIVMQEIRVASALMVGPLATATASIEAFGAASVAFLASPVGIAIAALTGLYLLLEAVTPDVSILGLAIGGLGAPFAFVFGLAKGFGKAFMEAIAPVVGLVGTPIALPFKILGSAISQALKVLQHFSDQGEQIGYQFASFLLTPFKIATSAIQGLWAGTVSFIMQLFKPFTDLANAVGQMLTSSLAENSPGPTFQIREKWGMTIAWLSNLLTNFLSIVKDVGSRIGKFISDGIVGGLQIATAFISQIPTHIVDAFKGIGDKLTELNSSTYAVGGTIRGLSETLRVGATAAAFFGAQCEDAANSSDTAFGKVLTVLETVKEDGLKAIQFVGGAIAGLILTIGKQFLIAGLVRKVLPQIQQGLLDLSKGSFFSAQKIGTRIAEIFAEALILPFESDLPLLRVSKSLVYIVNRISEFTENLFLNNFVHPVGEFLARLIPEVVWKGLSFLVPSPAVATALRAGFTEFLKRVITVPREIKFLRLGDLVFGPLLNVAGFFAKQRFENLEGLVKIIKELATALRPVFVLFEEIIPGVVIARFLQLAGAISKLFPFLRPLAPLLSGLIPVLGPIFQIVGIVLIAADALRTLTLVLKGASGAFKFLADAVAGMINVLATLLSYIDLGVKYLRKGIRFAAQWTINQLVSLGDQAGKLLLQSLGAAAGAIVNAWFGAGRQIAAIWTWLVGTAFGIRDRLVALLNHGAADVVGDAWKRTQETISGAFSAVVGFAVNTSKKIANGFNQSIDAVKSFFHAINESINNTKDAILGFNPYEFIVHGLAETVRGFIRNQSLFGVAVPAALKTILDPLVEKALIPSILGPFAKAVPYIIGLLGSLGKLNFGPLLKPLFEPKIPYQYSLFERIINYLSDEFLALGFIVGAVFTVKNITLFIRQLKNGLVPVIRAIYSGIVFAIQKIRELGGVVEFVRYGIAAAAKFLAQIKLPPWLQQLANVAKQIYKAIRPVLRFLLAGLQRAFIITSNLVRQFLAIPGVQAVVRAIVAGAQLIRQLLTPLLAPLANWFVDALIPGMLRFLTWFRGNISLIVSQLSAMVRLAITSPLGQGLIKGGIAIATGAGRASQSVARGAIAAGQKVGEAYVVATKVSAKIQESVNRVLPYLQRIAAGIGAVVRNTGVAVKKGGGFYRSFYLQKAGIPGEIADNAVNPLDFLPGAKAKGRREDKFKMALMADPFWKAREGTDLFNDKLKQLTKSFSGVGGAFNIFKTLPMLFTRPALAATVLVAQLEILLGVVLLVAAAGAYIYFRYPKTFHTIANIITKGVIPALRLVALILMTILPPAIKAIFHLFDTITWVIKQVLNVFALLGITALTVTEVIFAGLWSVTKVMYALAKATRIVENALWLALHGNFSELQAIGWLLDSVYLHYTELIGSTLVKAWRSLKQAIIENQIAIRTTIALLLGIAGVGAMVAATFLGITTPIGLLAGGLGILGALLSTVILPGATLQEKIQALGNAFTYVGHVIADIAVKAFNTFIQIGSTVLGWIKRFTQFIVASGTALIGLYAAIVLVSIGLNPLGLAIAGVGAFMYLSFTGQLESLAQSASDILNNILSFVRDWRKNLVDFLLTPFSLDPLFQSGADAISAFAKGFVKAIPIILIGFTLFNTLFKTGGNFIAGFFMSLKQLPVLFFKFIISPLTLVLRMLSNLSFTGGKKTREFFDDFDTQTNIKAAKVAIRSSNPINRIPGVGLTQDQAVKARREVRGRREISEFRAEAKDTIDWFGKYLERSLKNAALDVATTGNGLFSDFSKKELEQIKAYTQIKEKRTLFGLGPKTQQAELTDAGKDYIRGKLNQAQQGTLTNSVGIPRGFDNGVISEGTLKYMAEKAGINQKEFSIEDLRKIAFTKQGLSDWETGKIVRIVADKVEIQSEETITDAANEKTFSDILTPRGLYGAAIPKNAITELVEQLDLETGKAPVGANVLRKLLSKPSYFGDMSTGQLTQLSNATRSEYKPDDVAKYAKKSQDKSFLDKVRYQEEVFLIADVLKKLGLMDSKVLEISKSYNELNKIAGNYGNREIKKIKEIMKNLGFEEEEIKKINKNFENLKASRTNDKAFKASYLAEIYGRQYQLLLNEMVTGQSFNLPEGKGVDDLIKDIETYMPSTEGGNWKEYFEAQIDEAFPRSSFKELHTYLASLGGQALNAVSDTTGQMGGRDPSVVRRQLIAELFELFQAYAYKLETAHGEIIGTQGEPYYQIARSRVIDGRVVDRAAPTGIESLMARKSKIENELKLIQIQFDNAARNGAEGKTLQELGQQRLQKTTQLKELEERITQIGQDIPDALIRSRIDLMIRKIGGDSKVRRTQSGPELEVGNGELSLAGSDSLRMLKMLKDGGDFKVNQLRQGRFEIADPRAVRALASSLGLMMDELMTGVEFTFKQKSAIAQARMQTIEAEAMKAAKAQGMTGKKAKQFASFDNIVKEAGLSKSEIRNLLLGTGSLEAIEQLAEILDISRENLVHKIDDLKGEVTKSNGLTDRLKKLIQAPIDLLTQPLKGSNYQNELKSSLAALKAEEAKQAAIAAKRKASFEAITQKLTYSLAGKDYFGKDALKEILATRIPELKMSDIEEFIKTGGFKGDKADAKMQALSRLGDHINDLMENQGIETYVDLESLDKFNIKTLERNMIDRIRNQFNSYKTAVLKIFNKGDEISDSTEKEAKKQVSFLDKIAGRHPALARIAQIYKEYQSVESGSLQKLLQTNKMSLKQLQKNMDLLGVPFEQYAKFIRGQKVDLPTMKALSTIFEDSAFVKNYQKQIEAVREARTKDMEGLVGDELLNKQNALIKELKKIEENALEEFFGKGINVSKLPSFGQFALGKIISQDVPKLFKKYVAKPIWSQITKIYPDIARSTMKGTTRGDRFKRFAFAVGMKVAANVWRGSSRLVGFTVRSLTGSLYRRFMPRVLRTASRVTERVLQNAAVKLNAARGLFPRSKILAAVQKALLRWNENLGQYFNKTASDIEANSQGRRNIFSLIKDVFQRIFRALSGFIQSLPEVFEKAKNAATNQLGNLFNLIKGAFSRVIGLFGSLPQKIARGRELKRMRKLQRRDDGFLYPTEKSVVAARYDRMKAYKDGNKREAFVGGVVKKAESPLRGISQFVASMRLSTRFAAMARKVPKVAINVPQLFPRRSYQPGPTGSSSKGLASPLGKGGKFSITGYQTKDRVQEVEPIQRRVFQTLSGLARSATGVISNYFEGAARRSRTAWETTADSVAGKSWGSMVKRAAIAGAKILGFISEASPGPSYQTRQNWDHTAESVEGSMHEMAQSAQVAGHQIEGAMENSAKHSRGFLGGLKGMFGSLGGAGMAIGGAIGASGFALQSLAGSLTTLGLLDEESSQVIYKFSEFISIFGTIGGLVAPVFGAIVSSLGAILTIGATVLSVVFSPIGLAIAGVIGGVLLLNTAIKKLFGVDILGGIAQRIKDLLEAPFIAARDHILGAWQGMVDRFGPIIMPIVQPALELATKLIAALNHSPTERIPEAWEGAIARIKEQFFGWLDTGNWLADQLKALFDPEKLFGKLNEFLANVKLPNVGGWWSKLWKGKPKDKEVIEEPGVKLDQTQVLKRAYRLAVDSQDGRRAADTLAFKMYETKGQLDSKQIAELMTSATTGKFMQKAETQINNELFHSGGVNKRSGIEQYNNNLNSLRAASTEASLSALKEKRNLTPVEVDNFAFRKEQLDQDFQKRFARVQLGGKAKDLARSIGWDPEGLETAGTAALNEVDKITQNFRDRVDILRYGADPAALFSPGVERITNNLNVLGSDFQDFGKRAFKAIKKLDFNELGQAAKDFGGNFMYAAKEIMKGFGDMSLSAIAFGVFSLTSISPVVLILGGLGLVVAGLAFNFLGLRTIMAGAFKVVKGILQVVTGLVRGLVQVVDGAIKIFNGLFMALTGDFSLIKEGFQEISNGIQSAAQGLKDGLKNIFEGIELILKGVFQGIKQSWQAVSWAFGATIDYIRNLFKSLQRGVEILGNALITVLTRPQVVWQGFLDLLEKIKQTVQGVKDAIADSAVGRMAKAVQLRATGQAGSMESAKEMVDFDQRLKNGDQNTDKKPGFFGRLFGKKDQRSPEMKAFDDQLAAVPQPEVASSQVSGNLIGQKVIEQQKAAKEQTISDAKDVATTLTGILGMFAPAIAAPLMGMISLVEAIGSIGTILPTIISLFGGLTAGGGLLAGVFTAITGAASTAWAAISGPLLPIIAAVLGVIAVVALLWKAWETDFMGIRDIVYSTWREISGGFTWLMGVLMQGLGVLMQGAVQAIAILLTPVRTVFSILGFLFGEVKAIFQDVFGVLVQELGNIWNLLGSLATSLIEPFQPLLEMFGGSGGGSLGDGLKLALSSILTPLRLIAFSLSSLIKGVSLLVQGLILVGKIIVTTVLAPFQIIGQILWSAFVAPIQFVWSLMQSLGNLIQTIFQQIIGFVLGPLANLPFVGQFFNSQTGETQSTQDVPGFASGGWVTGPGTGTGDRIPAMLSAGEFVVPAKSALPNAGFLQAIQGGLDVESALAMAPIAPPMPYSAPPLPAGGGPIASRGDLPPIEINITFGDIVLNSATGPDQAEEFLNAIEPQLQQAIRESLRNLVEMMK